MNINLDRVAAAQELRDPENSRLHSILFLTGTLMLATDVRRLYTKADYRLFFRRIAILGNHYQLINDFFTDGDLFRCLSFGREIVLKPIDFIPMIGATFGSVYKVAGEEEAWLPKIGKLIQAANFIGLFSKNFAFVPDVSMRQEDDSTHFRFNDEIPQILPEQLENASIMAESMLSDIPDEVFEKWENSNPDAVSQYDKYVAEIAGIRQFDFDALDDIKKEAIYAHFRYYFDADEWNEEMVRKLTHLAWASANGHIIGDIYDIGTVAEYIDFDERGLEHDGGGINLFETIENYCLEELGNSLVD